MKRLARGKEGVAEAQKNADGLGEENKTLLKTITVSLLKRFFLISFDLHLGIG